MWTTRSRSELVIRESTLSRHRVPGSPVPRVQVSFGYPLAKPYEMWHLSVGATSTAGRK